MATGWQKSFKVSARYNRKMRLESNLRQAILDGALLPSDDIKHIARVYETSQKRVRELFQEIRGTQTGKEG
jgi:DNA-binding GntR family transcriptional regulator